MLKNLFKKIVDFVKDIFVDNSGKEYRIIYDDNYSHEDFANYLGGADYDGDDIAIDSTVLSKITEADIKEALKLNNNEYVIIRGRRR